MLKLKNIAIILCMAIFIILGINVISDAADLKNLKYPEQLDSKVRINQNYTLGFSNYDGDLKHKVFCINKDRRLTAENITYNVVDIVTIKGATATSKKDTTFEVTDKENAKLISAIYYAERNLDGDKGMRHAIWHNMYPWMKAVGEGFFEDVWKLNQDDTDVGYTNPKKRQEYLKKFDASGDYKNEDQPHINNLYENQQPNVSTYIKDDKKYFKIGPFKLDFRPNIDQLELRDKKNKIINEDYVSYLLPNNEIVNITSTIPSKKEFYILISQESNVEGIKSIYIKTYEKEVSGIINGVIVFLQAPSREYQNLIATHAYESENELVPEFININLDIDFKANLTINKIDEDTKKGLSGVKFRITNSADQYVAKDASGKTYLTGNESDLYTDENGKIVLEGLKIDKYTITEINNPNENYVISPNHTKEITLNSGNNEITINNKRTYVTLKGYVWVDNKSGKLDTINHMHDNKDDTLLPGVTVNLVDSRNGNKVTTTTDKNGAYRFDKVEIANLGYYYIQFVYNGLTYTNVDPNITIANGSKAKEYNDSRTGFNDRFSVIEGYNGSRNIGLARGSNGQPTWLNYDNNTKEHTSTLKDRDDINSFTINAETNTDNLYSIKVDYENRKKNNQNLDVIDNINLGLYKREQPEMQLVKDIQSVTVVANQKQHIYEYEKRFEKDQNGNSTDNSSRFGVEFGDKFAEDTYERAIYEADYVNALEGKTGLEVYVTYKIAVNNGSTTLNTKINSIVDYYDSRYSITAVGTDYKEGNVTNGLQYSNYTYDGTYNKAIINANMNLQHGKSDSIYIQFQLNKDALMETLDKNTPLEPFNKNIAEINSYSILQNDKAYAGIDKKSAPGNIVPGDASTYENDTDIAPSLKVKLEGTRTMAGSVFLDYTDGSLHTGEERQGDGEYGDRDKGIEGVDVTLTETSGSGNTYKAKTDKNGNFKFTDYVAGNYTVTYTWGGQEVDGTVITVQNYKATIYNDKNRQNNVKWHLTTEPRYSDAFDNEKTRENIDAQLNNVKYDSDTKININKMDSTTPTMDIEVEYNALISSGDLGPEYDVKNIDFGIVERARQEVELTKRVKTLKLTLANGQVISDATFEYDNKGNLKATGETSHMTYMGTNAKGATNRFIKMELDNELIQGANLEVGYEILFYNKSENDYTSKDYYKYGTNATGYENTVVKITPTAVIDYLDKDWSFEENKNTEGKWEALTLVELKQKDKVAKTVYEDKDSDINNKIILYTEKLKEKALKPTEEPNNVMLNVSKILTTSDEISLGNETEIVELEKNGGSKTSTIPGNYVPGKLELTDDSDMSEEVIVTPSTGENLNFVLPIVIGLVALVILGTGVVLIKKKVLDNKE